jgi:hypothetical protein
MINRVVEFGQTTQELRITMGTLKINSFPKNSKFSSGVPSPSETSRAGLLKHENPNKTYYIPPMKVA